MLRVGEQVAGAGQQLACHCDLGDLRAAPFCDPLIGSDELGCRFAICAACASTHRTYGEHCYEMCPWCTARSDGSAPNPLTRHNSAIGASAPLGRCWSWWAGDAIIGYHEEVAMTDVLIRDVPDDVIAALDAHAGRLGLSRSEYMRRRLAQDAAMPGSPVSVEDLARFADVFGDLADPDVMSRAWQ